MQLMSNEQFGAGNVAFSATTKQIMQSCDLIFCTLREIELLQFNVVEKYFTF